jgi:hypothetical protein
MKVDVVNSKMVRVQLTRDEEYLTEEGVRKLVRLLTDALFDMRVYGRSARCADSAAVFELKEKGGD